LKENAKKIDLSNQLVNKLAEDYENFLRIVSAKLEKIKD